MRPIQQHQRDRILSILDQGPATPAMIAANTGEDADTIRQRLRRMVKAGQARRLFRGVYMRTFDTTQQRRDTMKKKIDRSFGWKPTSELLQRGANLSNADLSKADLSDLDLTGAILVNANLSGADMSGAVLRNAALDDANLTGANIRDADLRDADLRGADMRCADITGSDLSGAQLQGVTMYAYIAGRRWTIRLEHGDTASQDQDQ